MTGHKHLVIDARAALPQVDGLGTYLRQVVPRLASSLDLRVTVVVHPSMQPYWRETAPSATVHPSDCRPMWTRQNWEIPRLLSSLAPDLFFYPAHDPPLFLRTPFIFTIHDLTPHLVRPYFERHDVVKTAYLRLATGHGVRRAAAVLAVSEATRKAIGDLFGASARERTVVTANGVSPPPAAPPLVPGAADERGFLYVGTDRPHKNLPRLIDAYALATHTCPGLPRLHIVGGLRSDALLRERIQRHAMAERVVLHGHIDDAQLEALYRGSLALLMPSLAEGFGMPIVEAMARGLPVITSRVSACPEVAGGAALLVDPSDTADIARAIAKIHQDPALRAELIRRGALRAAEFSWERCATETLAVIRSVLAIPA